MIGVLTTSKNGIARHVRRARRGAQVLLCGIALCALLPACKRTDGQRKDPPRTSAPNLGDALVIGSGASIEMVGVRGETLRVWGDLRIEAPGVSVQRLLAGPVTVTRPSTSMYGGSTGTGEYLDVLRPLGTGTPYSVLAIAHDAPRGTYTGTLLVLDGHERPLTLTIAPVTLAGADLPLLWAYYDPLELQWARLGEGRVHAPSPEEHACIAMFRSYGVLLSPDLPVAAWPARKALLAGAPYIPALIANGTDVQHWIAATRGTGQIPFAIPVDEPSTPEARERVRALATEARTAGSGPGEFLFAVTAEPRDEWKDLVDLYITLTPKRADRYTRWSYNGAPPRAGSMVVDTLAPGPRTWGWLQHRYQIPLWYVWDALYWHDRHNRKGAPKPGRALDHTRDATSFDNGEDHGNLDGVLAFPGDATMPCLPSVRLASIHRGAQDHALIAAALRCDPSAATIVERMIPSALGDVNKGDAPTWPTDEAAWERARRELIEIAARCSD
jgi:hypothetical protein